MSENTVVLPVMGLKYSPLGSGVGAFLRPASFTALDLRQELLYFVALVLHNYGSGSFAFFHRLHEYLYRLGHRGRFRGRGVDRYRQPGVNSRVSGPVAESGDKRKVLCPEARNERVDIGLAEESRKVVTVYIGVVEVVVDGTGKYYLMEVEAKFLHRLRNLGFMRFGENEELLLCFILDYKVHEPLEGTVGERNFAFPVNDIFLQIERYRFGIADIFHHFGDCDARFRAYAEKMVDTRAARENYTRMLQDIYPLSQKFFEANAFDTYQRHIIDLDAEFSMNVVVRRFFHQLRFGL